jgi:hypothetical protein
VVQLNKTGLPVAGLPHTVNLDCIKCLQTDAADSSIPSNGVSVQDALAGMMSNMLLTYHIMPRGAVVSYNAAKLPPSPEPGVSAVCHSCIINWAAEGSSMGVMNDREKMAHCHVCLHQLPGAWQQHQDTITMVTYGLAS